jgi:outer membrane protein insertion porin family
VRPFARVGATLVTLAVLATHAHAQSTETPPEEATEEAIGPVIVIEKIEVVGNHDTQADVILRALPVREGDALRAGDPRLREARFKALALGFFRDVTLGLRKGSAPGHVVLTVTVVERGTVVLDRLWFGNSTTSLWWAGAHVSERNFLGTGLAVGGGFVYAGRGDVTGSRDQWAARIAVADPSVLGTPYGIRGSFRYSHGSEPFRVGGPSDDDAADNFRAFAYQRVAARAGLTWDVTALTRLAVDARIEAIDAEVPTAPTRTLEDGRVVGIDLFLRPGSSEVVSVSVGLDRDTRSDPVLPRSGDYVEIGAELGSTLLGGSYDFASIEARYDRWWPAGRDGAVGVRLHGAVVVGDAPRFDRIHVGDVNRFVTPRALGLVVSAEGSPNLLGTGTSDLVYGEVGGDATLEYTRRLFRRGGRRVYGGDLFVGGGLWALSTRDDLALRDAGVWNSLPVDVVVDAGVRLDTEIGVFELTIANALARVPL